jgi:antitoxin component YwqK of YwqJK toxin-antitoxin module
MKYLALDQKIKIIIFFLLQSCNSENIVIKETDSQFVIEKEVLNSDTSILNGFYKKYMKNGGLMYHFEYKNDKLNGESFIYAGNELVYSIEFQNNLYHGELKRYSQKKLIEKEIYNMDKLFNRIYYFKLDKRLNLIFNFKNGNGVDLDLYNNKVSIHKIYEVKNGFKNGKLLNFNISGSLSEIGSYKNDVKVDTWYYSSEFYKLDSMHIFNKNGKKIKSIYKKGQTDERFGINSYNVNKESLKVLGFTMLD